MFGFIEKSRGYSLEKLNRQNKTLEKESIRKYDSRKIPMGTFSSESSAKTTGQTKETAKQNSNSAFKWVIKHASFVCFMLFFLLFSLSLLLLILFDFDMVNYILLIPASGGIMIVFPAIAKSVWDIFKPDKQDLVHHTSDSFNDVFNEKKARQGESFSQSTIYSIRWIWEHIFGNRLVRMALLLTIISVFASLAAHVAYEGHPGLRSFIPNRTQEECDSNPDEEIIDDEEQSLPSNIQSESELGPKSDSFLVDPERYYKLTDAEENALFFLDGPYKIMNWTDTYAIVNQLYPFVEGLLAPQTENIFDRDAPEYIKDEIAAASDRETHMTNSDELDSIIDTRTEAWQNYPKHGIAYLLANNMQRYAHEYTVVDGAYETIKYYHAQSIFWTWRSLAFDYVTPHMVKDNLNYISVRYHDIADMAANGSEEQKHALALCEAFKILKNMEFMFSDK